MSHATADLSDAHPDVDVAAPGLLDFGRPGAFWGTIATVVAPGDNTHVRGTLETPGKGRVLVVDGGAVSTCALFGDQLGALAEKNGWAGVVVNGCVRDSEALAKLSIGVKALATHPRKSAKRGLGARELPVTFLGVTFQPGAWLYADRDGVLVSPVPLTPVTSSVATPDSGK